MEFKVGDRVEALRGPSNTALDDYIGPGTVTAVRTNNRLGEDCQLDLDMGEKSWWFAEESLRPLKPNPTPSITVGTQVRLTGVVRQVQPNGVLGVDVYVGCQDGLHWFKPSEVEVIRQPFKRGEVVWFADGEIPCVVVEDESDNRVLLTECGVDKPNVYVETRHYERRP